jgi:hypothetical protein
VDLVSTVRARSSGQLEDYVPDLLRAALVAHLTVALAVACAGPVAAAFAVFLSDDREHPI